MNEFNLYIATVCGIFTNVCGLQ